MPAHFLMSVDEKTVVKTTRRIRRGGEYGPQIGDVGSGLPSLSVATKGAMVWD